MGKPELDKVVKLGKWLEAYLRHDTSNWELLKLFQEGAYLIGVDEKVSPSCGICLCLMGKLSEDQYPPETIKNIRNTTNGFLKYRSDLKKVLSAIHEYNLPWEKTLTEFKNDDFLYGFTELLRSSYSELRETIKKVDGEYRFTRSFSPIPFMDGINADAVLRRVQEALENHKDTASFEQGKQKIVKDFEDILGLKMQAENLTFELARNYRTIVARIFFDFFLYGGQGYFGFCEWCDDFFVSKRKLLKKYCSDKCRANHRNQINREKKTKK